VIEGGAKERLGFTGQGLGGEEAAKQGTGVHLGLLNEDTIETRAGGMGDKTQAWLHVGSNRIEFKKKRSCTFQKPSCSNAGDNEP